MGACVITGWRHYRSGPKSLTPCALSSVSTRADETERLLLVEEEGEQLLVHP
jgi:hypothetical protein